MRVCLARLWGHWYCAGSAHRRTPVAHDLWRRSSRARINQWRWRTRSLPVEQERGLKYARSNRVTERHLAAEPRRQARIRRSRLAPSLASSISWLCVSIKASGADCGRGREAMLVAAAAQFALDSQGCSAPTRPHTIHSLRRAVAGAHSPQDGLQVLGVSRANSSAKRLLAQALAGLHARHSVQVALVHQGQIQLLHHLPQWPDLETAPVRSTSHTARSAGSLCWRMEACCWSQCCAIRQALSTPAARGDQVRGRVWRKAFGNRLIKQKGNAFEHVPFYWIKSPAGLTDWHWALAGLFFARCENEPPCEALGSARADSPSKQVRTTSSTISASSTGRHP